MLIIDCPYCGERPELEFSYGGQAHIDRPSQPADLSDEDWNAFLYMRANPKGHHAERWRHIHGCARLFTTIRDTLPDHFLATPTGVADAPRVALSLRRLCMTLCQYR